MDDFFASLNDEQRNAVQALDGPVLINAGAGSGKTRVLTGRIALLLEQGVPPERILALTFTRKAAGEMRSRIVRMSGSEPDRVVMGTFHSVFIRFLREWAHALGYPERFTIYDEDDSESCLKECICETLYGIDWKQVRKGMDSDKVKGLEASYRPSSLRSRISLVNQIQAEFAFFKENAEKAISGNKSAGVRARKISLEIEKKLKLFRKQSVTFGN